MSDEAGLEAALGPTLDEVIETLRPFVRRNTDGSFVTPKDEALADLMTLATSMAKTIASLPAPQGPAAQVSEPVKAGFVLMPVEPTEAMIEAGRYHAFYAKKCYRAMLDAAPQPSPDTGAQGAEPVQPVADWKIEGASSEIEAAACALWAVFCPGLVMDERDQPHYEEAAKAALAAAKAYRDEAAIARPLSEWAEEHGNVVWWCWRDGEWLGEPAYIGTPLDLGQTVEVSLDAYGVDKLMRANVGGWPGYHTHWTPHPELPAAPALQRKQTP